MSQSNFRNGDAADDELQFSTAEPIEDAAEEAAKPCAGCQQPIESQYYALQDMVICPACAANLQPQAKGTRVGRLAKATLFGLGAGLLGALIWFAIRRATGYEIGLIAILLGFMVGKAVFAGSGNRGGVRYQILAVLITYSCIAANYVPDIVEAFITIVSEQRTGESQPVAAETREPASATERAKGLALLVVIIARVALAHPFHDSANNIIGLLIIGFALWEAWKLAQRRVLPITGPYLLGGAAPNPAGGG